MQPTNRQHKKLILPKHANDIWTVMENIPQDIDVFVCSYNYIPSIASLPIIPQNLRVLVCIYSVFEVFPKLADTLIVLNCENNNLCHDILLFHNHIINPALWIWLGRPK